MSQNRIVWILALIMASISAWLVFRTTQQTKVKPAEIPTETVLVAKVSIPARFAIKPEWVELRTIPVNAIPGDAARSGKDVVGKISKSEILAGEAIRKGRLLKDGELLGLPLMIPPGYRGMTVKVDEVVGIGGFVRPGDLVDVLVTLDENVLIEDEKVTITLLQSVQVLAAAQDLEAPTGETAKKGKVSSSVTMAVNPEQAQKLALAEETGKIRLVMRPLNYIDSEPVNPVSPKNLIVAQKPKPVPRIVYRPKPVAPKRPKQVEVISGSTVTHVNVD